MDIRDLEYLVASASAGNFSRAARSLGLTTSTVSRRIGRLEDELGLALFERGHFGVRPTRGGRAVLLDARRALADLNAVKRSGAEGASGEVGEIHLGVAFPPTGEFLTSLLADWRGRNPNVVLTVTEMNDRDLVAALEERRLDVALMLSHALAPHAVCERLYRDRLLMALPAGHPLAEQPCISCDDLAEEIILVQGWEESPAISELHASFVGGGAKLRSHAASKQSILALVGAGFGMTLTTASQSEAELLGVVFREIDDPDASIEIALAWLPELEDATIGRFVAFFRDESRLRG